MSFAIWLKKTCASSPAAARRLALTDDDRRRLAVRATRDRIDIESVFTQINDSFKTATIQLKNTFQRPEWQDSPFVYHMPEMHLSMRLVPSHSDGKVKGFFHKGSLQSEQELTSIVEIDIVAVPRSALPGDLVSPPAAPRR